MANVNDIAGTNNNYLQQIKNAKVAIVMNCQIFRFWESMFKSSIMGQKTTIRLLSYLVFFAEIIFEDYKLRINKLAKLMSAGVSTEIGKIWEQHINIFSIPLIKSITKIICINCREYLNEYKLSKPWDNHHHHHYNNIHYNHNRNNRTFYQYFIDMFCSLFKLNNNLGINPIQIHNDILYEIGQIVSNNLIRISIFTRIDLKMKLIESMRQTFIKQDKLQDIYIDCVSYILENIQNGNIPDTIIPQPIYIVHENN
eukprot:201557_1